MGSFEVAIVYAYEIFDLLIWQLRELCVFTLEHLDSVFDVKVDGLWEHIFFRQGLSFFSVEFVYIIWLIEIIIVTKLL